MTSLSYSGRPRERRRGYANRMTISNVLPLFSSWPASSAEREKYSSYAGEISCSPRTLYTLTVAHFGRRKRTLALCLLFIISFLFVRALFFRYERRTLVFRREDLQRIWHWEVSSGHFPSRQGIPVEIQLKFQIENPALPPQLISNYPSEAFVTTTRGMGARRTYIESRSAPGSGFPPRPVPGSIIDFDIVMQHCDFKRNKFVRDCLEVMRFGAGLDHGKKTRRTKLDDWKYIYLEQPHNATSETRDFQSPSSDSHSLNHDRGLRKHHREEWETPPILLRQPPSYVSSSRNPTHCDPESPRIFHMFWAGEFTDKPYMAILSFLFTQNTGLHLKTHAVDSTCRPQFWVWINPGPAASVPNPNAEGDMLDRLKVNPWSSAFLHPQFKDVIRFKMWNTTEQLDNIPELKDEWRTKQLFKAIGASKGISDDVANRVGSKSWDEYDSLSVILSDMARFILCHRFGGIYLDADTVFLRDWEEVWGWKGAFAYRWSRLDKYNTAVLHLNKKSALGSFLFKTALKNDMDFHPFSIYNYVKDAHLGDLLLGLPVALFDPAWLSTEGFQLNRPPQPFFKKFEHFFETPARGGAAPQALGFEGFFSGAYSYHYHNNWWRPFDPSRNWPDLGPRFSNGEKLGGTDGDKPDQRDLDWSTVLKRVMESYIRGERPNLYGELLETSEL